MLIAKAVEKGALFEARITCVDKSQAKFKVVGEVQRVNMYGNQSWCISGSAAAKKFCIVYTSPVYGIPRRKPGTPPIKSCVKYEHMEACLTK